MAPGAAAAAAAAADAAAAKPARWKPALLAVLAIACGFLTFNFHYIIKTSHVHLTLAHHHRTTAFCAFTMCKFHEDLQEIPAGAADKAGSAGSSTAKAVVLPSPPAAPPPQLDPKLAQLQKIMEARECGSPAVDGYAHVVPKCLEESPTNKWWMEYYANGGKQGDLVAHIEEASDYDGLAVYWGINNKKQNAQECAEHCLRHMPNPHGGGPYDKLPCNAFAFCPDEVCFEPDAHHHTKGDCWLKFTEGPAYPEVNMRGDLPPDYKKRHPTAPNRVQWISGVLLPPGVKLTNGTFGPRWKWRR